MTAIASRLRAIENRRPGRDAHTWGLMKKRVLIPPHPLTLRPRARIAGNPQIEAAVIDKEDGARAVLADPAQRLLEKRAEEKSGTAGSPRRTR